MKNNRESIQALLVLTYNQTLPNFWEMVEDSYSLVKNNKLKHFFEEKPYQLILKDITRGTTIKNNWPECDLNSHNHWTPFRCSNQLSYQAMVSSPTQSQLYAATPISYFAQCQISFWLLPVSVTMFS